MLGGCTAAASQDARALCSRLTGKQREVFRRGFGIDGAVPNAGFPKRVGDRTIYPKSSPEYFALFAREAAALGARILGGCCGTTPEHIRALAEAVKTLRPGKGVEVTAPVRAGPEAKRVAARQPESRLWKKLQAKHFVVSVAIDPPKGGSLDRVFEQADRIMACG